MIGSYHLGYKIFFLPKIEVNLTLYKDKNIKIKLVFFKESKTSLTIEEILTLKL